MSKALYRKYRSTSLDEVVGQGHITKLLKKALTSGRTAHAYLFTGPRGVGKTSIARILAYEINKLPYEEDTHHLDVIEIDAASNNGVEDVRDLREKVQIAPVSASKKIYIIDEVHMLSKPAFNALLKTLEEPPEHIVFILATTDVHKLPATIISRTQHFGFKPISKADATAHLKHIAKEEKILITDEALGLIAEHGDGSFRDSISILDQISGLHDGSKSEITAKDIEETLGLATGAHLDALITAHEKNDLKAAATQLNIIESEGINPVVLVSQLISKVQADVTTNPQLLTLLDALLDVPKSSHPYIKLLSALCTPPKVKAPMPPQELHKSKNIALAAPVHEVKATVESLKKADKPAPKKAAVAATEEEPKREVIVGEPTDFNWIKLINYTREHFVALYSVLSKCTPELDGNSLTLFTGSAFYKKKLDDTKYSTYLHESLQTLGMLDIEFKTVPEQAPMKDSQASAIADIMGGGVEVAPDAVA